MGYFSNVRLSSLKILMSKVRWLTLDGFLRYPMLDSHFGPEEGPGCPVWLAHLVHNYGETA